MPAPDDPIHGRGSASNPPNRFIPLHYESADDAADPDAPSPATRFFRDSSKSIITYNDSPDVGFTASINHYRGCEHGCAYCYARPTHEYLGFSAGLDFETRILVKEDVPELLARAGFASLAAAGRIPLRRDRCYQPIERRLRLTRRCLEVFAEFRNPVGIVTKSQLVTRDLDLLANLARTRPPPCSFRSRRWTATWHACWSRGPRSRRAAWPRSKRWPRPACPSASWWRR